MGGIDVFYRSRVRPVLYHIDLAVGAVWFGRVCLPLPGPTLFPATLWPAWVDPRRFELGPSFEAVAREVYFIPDLSYARQYSYDPRAPEEPAGWGAHLLHVTRRRSFSYFVVTYPRPDTEDQRRLLAEFGRRFEEVSRG
jgi:hypothetical protein